MLRAGAAAAQLRKGRLPPNLVARHEHHSSAHARQPSSGNLANARSRTCDDNDLALHTFPAGSDPEPLQYPAISVLVNRQKAYGTCRPPRASYKTGFVIVREGPCALSTEYRSRFPVWP